MGDGVAIMLYGALFAAVSALLLQKTTQVVPSPFIDEIFHVPQAQQYCQGSFEKWDDKITTPPGLYIFSIVLQLPLLLLSKDTFCNVIALRAVNVLFNTSSMFLIYYIMKEIHKPERRKNEEEEEDNSANSTLKIQAVTLALFPLNYFFSFLYYTDPGSTMFVLAAYLANLRSLHKTSALLGLVSIFFRQTNIVWVVFFAGSTAAKEMLKAEDINKIETSPEIKDKLVRFLVGIISAAVKYLLVVGNLLRVLKLVWPYIFVFVTFVAFVFVNNGIVLGDKTNHEASFHSPQILYFFSFTLFFSLPILMTPTLLKRFLNTLLKNPVKFLIFGVVFAYMIIKHTHIHKFLLSDNRHYPFYLCRYVLRFPLFRILLTPVYVYAGWAMKQVLDRPSCSGIWKLVFLICTCAATVPQKLIELRYFIVPYVIFRLNVHIKKQSKVFLEFLLYLAVNAFTLYIFFTKEVIWPDMAEPQRIIW